MNQLADLIPFIKNKIVALRRGVDANTVITPLDLHGMLTTLEEAAQLEPLAEIGRLAVAEHKALTAFYESPLAKENLKSNHLAAVYATSSAIEKYIVAQEGAP